MEFIPIKKSKKTNKTVTVDEKPKKLNKTDKFQDESQKKGKRKPQTKIIEKKVVKSERKDTVTKRKPLQKAVKRKKEEEEENVEDEEEINDESDEEQEEREGVDEDEEAFKRKCNQMDEKKKNRLFIKLKKKISNEMQIKELHPDIRSVIFPRKKKTRWCWAVFASQEKAAKALKALIKNQDIIASKPTPYEKVEQKRKEKMKTILRKKQAKKKLQELWM